MPWKAVGGHGRARQATHLRREAAQKEERARVRADHVDDEDEAAPCGDHVDIGEAREDAPHDRVARGAAVGDRRVLAQRAHPAEERHRHRRQCDRLVVVAAAHRAHQVRRHDRHDEGGDGTGGVGAGALLGEQAEEARRRHAEPRGNEHAHVVERHGRLADGQPHGLPDGDRRDLHARVDGRADGPAERVPRLVVEPREELRPSVVGEVLGRAEVEPAMRASAQAGQQTQHEEAGV